MVITGLILIGLCLGSFVNALVWRLKQKRDWIHERSECVHCGHALKAKDLIPIVSWLSLRGKCRYCRKPISAQYPLVEITTALLFVGSYLAWPDTVTGLVVLKFTLWLLLLTILVALAVYDLKYMLLPNRLVLAGGVIVLIYTAVQILTGEGVSYMLDALLGLLAFGGIFYVLFQISDGRWIGGGDVKLGFVLGAWLASPILSFLAIFAASLIGTVLVVVFSLLGKVTLKTKVPFGPMLIAGTIIMTLYGVSLVDAYYQLVIVS